MIKEFNIERGVGPGCPFSMLLFVIFPESFYRAVALSINVKPFILPCKPRKILGYVDDTSFLVYDDSSIIECLKILKNFELASSIKQNKNKTKFFGMFSWKNRQLWSVQDVNIIHENIKIFGNKL